MFQTVKTTTAILSGFVFLGIAHAGETEALSFHPEPEESHRNWCDAFDRIGEPLYKNKESRFLQRLDVFGRVHWQYAYIDGEDVEGNGFHDSFDEWRRIRVGAEAQFFDYFTLKAAVNLMDDDRPEGFDSDFGFRDFDQIKLTTNIGKMIGTGGFDSLKLIMGRMKFDFTPEAHTSSRRIKTVERSAISNKAFNSGRGTGVLIAAEKGAFAYTAGVFGDEDPETLGGFDNGLTYYASVEYEASEAATYLLDAAYNDGDDNDPNRRTKSNFLEYDWAVSLAGIYDFGNFEFMWNAVYGDNRGEGAFGGNFYGLVLMPSYWIVENKLEAVVRYQYQGAEEDQGISLNNRYLQRADDRDVAEFARGNGDEHHSIYAGLNWLLCGHNLKVMTGVEYETLEAPGTLEEDADAVTYWLAARTYF